MCYKVTFQIFGGPDDVEEHYSCLVRDYNEQDAIRIAMNRACNHWNSDRVVFVSCIDVEE